jgi:ABC-2 type transport system ATP-binding protein
VAIIDQGELIACDTPARLVASLGAGAMLKTSLELPLEAVRPLPGVIQARYTGQHLEVETRQPNETLVALGRLAEWHGKALGDISVRQPNLEDVFLHLTGRMLEV